MKVEGNLKFTAAASFISGVVLLYYFEGPYITNKSNSTTIEYDGKTTRPNNCTSWGDDLILFIPVGPNIKTILELKSVLLPSLALFWPPESLNAMFITDGEKFNVGAFRNDLLALVVDAGIDTSQANVSVTFNFVTDRKIREARPWHRQQWLMFWADNFTQVRQVGFVDSDSLFVTPILRSDLFVDDRPIVRPVFGKAGKGLAEPWFTFSSYKALGILEPFEGMTYFPVIIKTKHLPLIREHIRQQFDRTTFDEAFTVLIELSRYSQFSIMASYLWYFHRDEYYWTVREREPGWNGPYYRGQQGNRAISRLADEYLQRYMPSVAIHWSYEGLANNEGHPIEDAMKTGTCYSALLSDRHPKPKMCGNVTTWEAPNMYEWRFEHATFMHNESATLAAHRHRLSLLKMCPRILDHHLLAKHFSDA